MSENSNDNAKINRIVREAFGRVEIQEEQADAPKWTGTGDANGGERQPRPSAEDHTDINDVVRFGLRAARRTRGSRW
jgi:hypothetical protein